ncbi:MAG TPA: phosphate regulon sensor histidine kinase PhoR [Polaromonas sp.]|uniref:phosphate regulon sensor histidine kinase PhoR n=1 Tax=Polaromonas sp. TaxID=1869339 RepID=UPI002D3421EC|nr:phosphate regulon sensor histidine kinase PhoR [Polaromonas sp.]HYW58847.1 phosphate regulon sensor histidine kinase PhoR [Polaromonas sp.]
MVWRVFRFFLFQLTGALLGGFLPLDNHFHGVLLGIGLASALWVLLDLRRGMVLLNWLKTGDTSNRVRASGLWGEVADRTWRLTKNQERKIEESRSRLNEFLAAIQASPNGVVLLDAQGCIEWCNETAADHFGFDPQRDVLQHIGNLLRDPGFVGYLNSEDYARDLVIPGARSTSSRPVQLAVHLHRYGEGRKLLLSRDVTSMEQADVMRRDFVANVSHEIRTPLTVMSGFVETLQTLPLNEDERARYLELMAQQARRMQTLVSDLLTLSKLEGSPPPSATEWVTAAELMLLCEQDGRDLSKMLVAQSHDLRFSMVGNCEIAGSHSELLSAMSNLVSNAVRYTPAGESIDVRWQKLPDGRAVFSVKDSGPGIAPEHIPRLTERFYRIDRSRSRETGGTGLGLAIVKHVTQRHGAELQIESQPGQGSRFSIIFPATRLRQSQPEARVA